MFDYEKLIAYNKARAVNKKIFVILKRKFPYYIHNQLYRASVSMVINIAEGAGKLTKHERRNFYVISRGSVYECASLLDLLEDSFLVTSNEVLFLKKELEVVSRLLSGLIKSLS